MTFNRPERRNALSGGVYVGFENALPAIANDPDIRVLMLTGAGGAFCAGGDVKAMNERNRAAGSDDGAGRVAGGTGTSTEAKVADLRARQRQVSLALRQLPQPVVAALPGAAAGAGLSIALAADLRIAAERAVLVTAFSGVGGSGDFGGSWFLTHLVGSAKAKELYFLSPKLSAAEAAGLGLVNQVLPDDGFDAAALEYCHRLAERATDRVAVHEGEHQPGPIGRPGRSPRRRGAGHGPDDVVRRPPRSGRRLRREAGGGLPRHLSGADSGGSSPPFPAAGCVDRRDRHFGPRSARAGKRLATVGVRSSGPLASVKRVQRGSDGRTPIWQNANDDARPRSGAFLLESPRCSIRPP